MNWITWGWGVILDLVPIPGIAGHPEPYHRVRGEVKVRSGPRLLSFTGYKRDILDLKRNDILGVILDNKRITRGVILDIRWSPLALYRRKEGILGSYRYKRES